MYCKWKSKDILLSLKQCLLNVKIVYMNVNIWISVDKSKYLLCKGFTYLYFEVGKKTIFD